VNLSYFYIIVNIQTDDTCLSFNVPLCVCVLEYMITIPGNFPVDLVATPAQNGAGDPERAFLVHEDNNGAPRCAGARGVPVGGANIDALPVLAGFGVGVGA